MSPLYQLHGLRLRSEVPLSAGIVETSPPNGARPHQEEVEIRQGPPRSVPGDPPGGKLLAELSLPGGTGYSLTQSANGYLLRFYRTCEIEISKDLKSLEVHADPAADPEMIPLLVEGNAVAVILGLGGHFVFHASAVSTGGSAVGFVGGAGMGKSTMAAVMCAAGASLIADDLLRVEFEEEKVLCHHGPQVIRLRPGASSLANRLNGPAGTSPDGRTTIGSTALIPETQTPALRALIIPQPSHDAPELELRRLSPPQALLQLARHPRVTGWKTEGPWHTHFHAAAQTAKTIPTYTAKIPWGPPFHHHLAEHLLEAVGLATQQAVAARTPA